MLPRDERLLGNDDDDNVVIVANDPCWLKSRTPAGAGGAMALVQYRWGRRRGRRPLQGRHDDTYPVTDRIVGFYLYLYLYLYLYPSAVVVRGGVVLIPILLFLT